MLVGVPTHRWLPRPASAEQRHIAQTAEALGAMYERCAKAGPRELPAAHQRLSERWRHVRHEVAQAQARTAATEAVAAPAPATVGGPGQDVRLDADGDVGLDGQHATNGTNDSMLPGRSG